MIEGVRAEIAFELEEVDITGDDELEPRYRERIPVVLVDGEEAFTYFVTPDGLRRRVEPRRTNSPAPRISSLRSRLGRVGIVLQA